MAVDVAVDLHADRAASFLGELAEQPGRAGQQGEAAQQLDRQAEVGQRRAADPGAVERQPAAEHLLVDPADGLEQGQVRPAQALLGRRSDQDRGPRVALLVHRMAEPGNEAPGRPGRPHRLQRECVPALVVGRQVAVVRSSTSCRKAPQSSVTPRKREPPPSSPAASAPCSESGADR